MKRKKTERGRFSRHGALRFCAMALAVAVLLGLLVKACNYLLVDDASSYTRLTLHEFYEAADEGEQSPAKRRLTWDPPPRIMTLPIIFSGRRPATTI